MENDKIEVVDIPVENNVYQDLVLGENISSNDNKVVPITNKPSQYYRTNPTKLNPQSIFCPQCNKMTDSSLTYETGRGCYITAIVMCFIGCFLCFWIPFVTKYFKDVKHYCSNCNHYFGKVHFVNESDPMGKNQRTN